MPEAVIVSVARTPIGRAFKGSLKDIRPDDRARLDRLAHGRDWLWLEGNHDREALARDAEATGRLPGRIVGGLSLGRLRLVHERAKANPRRGK